MPAPRIVVVGSSNTDLVITSKHLPTPGETVLGGQFQRVAGGKGANQAVAAARCGGQVSFVANIGRDDLGDAAMRRLRTEGIHLRAVVRSQQSPSGVALILVDGKGENLISVARSSNNDLAPRHIDDAAPLIQSARCLVAQLEVPLPAVRRAVDLAHRAGVPVLLNPAPAQPLPRALLRKVTWLTPNETELAFLTGARLVRTRAVVDAAAQLLQAGVQHVLVTCGARGVCWCCAEGVCWIPAPRVKPVDTVGAGDCFTGALAAALARGEPLEDALPFAVTAASISVTRPGAQPSMPKRSEVLRRWRAQGQA